nr:immunoglobulin heavy chain junction region [Mus musculus]
TVLAGVIPGGFFT